MASKGKVLLAGLQGDTAEKMRAVLETAGFGVVRAPDGREALQTALASRPDLILLDLVMPTPETKPKDLLESLSQYCKTAGIPIVLVSATATNLPKPEELPATVKGLLPSRFEPTELIALIDSYLAPVSQLESKLRLADPDSRPIVSDTQCRWIRSRLGIVGIVCIEEKAPVDRLRQVLAERVAHAYAMLDGLPADHLSSDDAWNLLLIIAIPWTKEEMSASPEVAAILSDYAQDLTGSRKIIFWQGSRMSDHLGPLGEAPTDPSFSSPDPLQVALAFIARDQVEHDALKLLFRRRLVEEEVQELIQVLGRKDEK